MKKIVVLFFIVSIFSCTKEPDETANNNNVSVNTVEALNIGEGGVTLKGTIQGVGLPLNYGFIVATYQGGTYDNTSNFISLNGTFNGAYSMDIRDNLIKGETYHYNAVAYANNEFIFGDEKTFISNGNTIPKIESVIPDIAHISDTITISGKYFSSNPLVFFDEIQANTIVKNDSVIKAIVPYGSNGIQPFTSIKVKKQTSEETLFNGFSLYKPEVISIEPSTAYETDTLVIKGNHFDIEPTRNLLTMDVFGNDWRLQITSSSRTEIIVAGGVGAFYEVFPKFKLKSQHQTIAFNDKLKALMPTITGAPDCIKYGRATTIYGENFPRASGNSFSSEFSLKIGNKSLAAQAIYRDSIVLNIDDGFYEDFMLKDVTINYLGEKIVFEKDICLDEPWIKVSYDTPILTHSYQNEIYGIVYQNNNTFVTIGKFNIDNYTFESVNGAQIPVEVRYGPLKTFSGSKLYHFSTAPTTKAFTSFDFLTNQLVELAPFPGENRVNGLIAATGDFIYMGLGATVTNQYFSDIWKYSITNNTWEKILDFPGISSYTEAKITPLTFVIDNKIYIGAGQPNGYYSDFWELNTNTNILTAKAYIPTPISGVNKGTNLGSKGYFESGYLYEYNELNDTWKIYNDIDGLGFRYPGEGQSMFNHQGIIYRHLTGTSSILFKLNSLYLDL